MKLSPNHLKRYKEIAQLFWKYGRSDLVKQMGIDEAVDPQALTPASAEKAAPDQLADDLEAMGPTYVKLGQVLSSRSDLLPEPYLKALARLQDKVKPFSFAEVEEIVEPGQLDPEKIHIPGIFVDRIVELPKKAKWMEVRDL